ncbi:hypothetical protein DZC41_01945 [Acinetobacter haemolyticus]|uniref:hypothetical protein n=1 Tax=Acinetobacter haemolyticus TaxID=29430 RepID=UPI0009493F27|nr:hypothetical protein [Acinetobacter haemolyticus]APR69971.1 hypothetical protein AHTJS_06005 [Acinetobacter haemolyticus]NAR36427.1 hypothetical protein [Acinetobacter haemolyticus]NCU22267.1 hypothetical protein [Acinetobacter haemolyticus]
MDALLKITGVIAALVIPIVLCILNNRIAKIKHSREHQAELLKLAGDFENGIESKPILYRDRMAKHLFNNEYLTYEEAKFFSVYENADLWVQEYSKVRGFLKKERNENGVILNLKPKYNALKIILALVGYAFFCFIGLIPFIIIHKYISWITHYYEKGILLNCIGFIAVPILSLIFAWYFLKYVQKSADCGIFLHDFENEAFKQVELEIENT